MFTRYSLCATPEELAQRFKIDVPEGYKPSYNAAPSHLLPVITQDAQTGLSFFYWGAPPVWANKKPLGEKIINTRAELFSEKQVLKKKLRDKKCIIPADGFYEWKKTGRKAQIPYRFTRKDKLLFAMAGLWEEYDDEQGDTFHTFSVVTQGSTDSMVPYNERTPLVLDHRMESSWLNATDEKTLLEILATLPGEFDHYSVSTKVNSVDRNDRTVIAPAPAADQFGNLSLFD